MPAGTGKPPFANTLSKLSLNKTNARPASGFAPPACVATPLVKDKTALPGATAPVGIVDAFPLAGAAAVLLSGAFDTVVTGGGGADAVAPGTRIPRLHVVSSGANVKSPSLFCP